MVSISKKVSLQEKNINSVKVARNECENVRKKEIIGNVSVPTKKHNIGANIQ